VNLSALRPLCKGILLLACLAALIPLLPAQPLPALAGLRPAALLGFLCLLLGLQILGHLAVSLVGPRRGLLLAGALGGLVSSTATVLALAARARLQPPLSRACAAGALLSCASTWLQALVMLLALAPQAALLWLPVALTGAGIALVAGLWLARSAPRQGLDTPASSPLQLRKTLLLALLLTGVSLGVGWGQRHFGNAGVYLGVALAGLADAHAPLAPLAALVEADQLSLPQMLACMLLAIASSSLTRGLGAWAAGGAAFARPLAAMLALSLLAAAAVLWGILAALR